MYDINDFKEQTKIKHFLTWMEDTPHVNNQGYHWRPGDKINKNMRQFGVAHEI